jgi:hypothetical protein
MGMDFFKRLTSLFSGPRQAASEHFYDVTVRCLRCGEVIHARINLHNDLSAEYGDGGRPATYHCRKLLLGKQRCFQQIEVTLTFDAAHQVLERQITGGAFVEA